MCTQIEVTSVQAALGQRADPESQRPGAAAAKVQSPIPLLLDLGTPHGSSNTSTTTIAYLI